MAGNRYQSDMEIGMDESDCESEPFMSFSVPTTNRCERRESDRDTGGWRKQVQVQVRKRKKDSNGSVNDNSFTSLSTDDKLVKNI